MELLFILPLLLGYAVYDMFWGGGSSSAQSDSAADGDSDAVYNGTPEADTYQGGADQDFALGAGKADKLAGGADADVLLGEGGADTLSGNKGADLLLGGAGNDRLSGGNGADFLVGGNGADKLFGESGADLLIGSSGQDTLYGGTGGDVLSSVDITGNADPLAVNFATSSAGAADALAALKADLQASFGDVAGFNDPTTAPSLNRVEAALRERGTSDADDLVFGGAGNDTIFADLSDTVTSGTGSDEVNIISDGAGQALVVTDFTPGQDKINVFVPAGTNPAISLINGATPEAGVSVVVAGDTVAVLKGLVAANLPAGAIEVIVGS